MILWSESGKMAPLLHTGPDGMLANPITTAITSNRIDICISAPLQRKELLTLLYTLCQVPSVIYVNSITHSL